MPTLWLLFKGGSQYHTLRVPLPNLPIYQRYLVSAEPSSIDIPWGPWWCVLEIMTLTSLPRLPKQRPASLSEDSTPLLYEDLYWWSRSASESLILLLSELSSLSKAILPSREKELLLQLLCWVTTDFPSIDSTDWRPPHIPRSKQRHFSGSWRKKGTYSLTVK